MIITSLLDNDFYKFTMAHAVLKTKERLGIQMPHVLYRFRCRNNVNLLPYRKEIEKEIQSFLKLSLTPSDIDYISQQIPGLHSDISTKTRLSSVSVYLFDRDNQLNIEIEGPWFPAILLEVPILAIVNEVYFKHNKCKKAVASKNLQNFLTGVHEFYDFGTRRRYSREWQKECIKRAIVAGKLKGTSNIKFAKDMHLSCVGTMAHEWLAAFQVLSSNLRNFQSDALDHWMLTYRGRFDTALTDIIGIDNFLNDYDALIRKNYRVLRHDSGSPYEFIDKIDLTGACPKLLFSDGLTAQETHKISDYCWDRDLSHAFGIGTNFTNNCGITPLQIVIKLVKVNGSPVAKLSDSAGKQECADEAFLQKLKTTFNMEIK